MLMSFVCYADEAGTKKKTFIEVLYSEIDDSNLVDKDKQDLKSYIEKLDVVSESFFLKEYSLLSSQIRKDAFYKKPTTASFCKMYFLTYSFLKRNQHQYSKVSAYQDGLSFYFSHSIYIMLDYEDAIKFSDQNEKYTFVEDCLFRMISFLTEQSYQNSDGKLDSWFMLNDMINRLKLMDAVKFESLTKNRLLQQIKHLDLLNEQVMYFYSVEFMNDTKDLSDFAILPENNYSLNFVAGEKKGLSGLLQIRRYRVAELEKAFKEANNTKE